jgi:hypothetical protein
MKYQVIAIDPDCGETVLQIHEKRKTAELAIDTFYKIQDLPSIIQCPNFSFKIVEIEND